MGACGSVGNREEKQTPIIEDDHQRLNLENGIIAYYETEEDNQAINLTAEEKLVLEHADDTMEEKHYDSSKFNNCSVKFEDELNYIAYKQVPKNFKKKGIHKVIFKFSKKLKSISFFFNDCRRLVLVDLTYFDFSKVIDASYLFRWCTKLRKVRGLDFIRDSPNLQRLSNMFLSCWNLEGFNCFFNWNISNCSYLNQIFSYCTKLKEIDLSKIILEKEDDCEGINLSWLFCGCKNLQKVNLFKFRAPPRTIMKGVFEECENLEELDLSMIRTNGDTDVDEIFDGCSKLKTIFLKENTCERIVEYIDENYKESYYDLYNISYK